MMNADHVQLNAMPTQKQVRQPRQAFKLADNRPSAIAQAKLICSLLSGLPLQRAATINQNARTPSAARTVYKSDWDRTNKIVTFSATPGFGQNHGELGAYSYDSHGAGHSEPNLISMNYSANNTDADGAVTAARGINPNVDPNGVAWSVANTAIDAANLAAGGVANRAPFILYSELEPCRGCRTELGNARYKAADIVNRSITHDANSIGNIMAQYIGIANAWLNQNYTYMNPNRTWGMGYVGITPKLLCHY